MFGAFVVVDAPLENRIHFFQKVGLCHPLIEFISLLEPFRLWVTSLIDLKGGIDVLHSHCGTEYIIYIPM